MKTTALLLALVATAVFLGGARAATVLAREPSTLRIGERVLVDDGSCPAGQIREVTGIAGKTPGTTRIERLSQCVTRRVNR